MLTLLLFVLVGIVVGLLAGLFGVGGGLVIVPVLAATYVAQGMDMHVMQLAIGTSLASIVFTSLSSIYAHHKKHAVLWPVWWQLLPGVAIGAVLGALVVAGSSNVFLARFFAVFEILVGLKIWFQVQTNQTAAVVLSRGLAAVAGFTISLVSTIVGIGGGTMSVPFLLWRQVTMPKAVATASAVGLPIAVVASVGFMWTGFGAADLPDYSLGYVHVLALLPICIASVLVAPLGVKLAHRLPPVLLQKMFAVLLLVLGLKMLWQF